MNTNIQIKVDEWVVKPTISLLNILVIVVGKILRIDHSLANKKFQTIAVCKYKGMGSIIQATPLLKNLRIKYPNAKIIFITTPCNKEILKKIKEVDEIISLNDSSFISLIKGIMPFIFKLMKSKIQVYIDLEVYSNFSTLVTILSLAKNRLGFYLQSKHYRMGNYTHMMYHNTRSPIMETYLQFARLLGCDINPTYLTELESNITHINIIDDKKPLQHIKYVVINPNASDLRLERRWGKEKYNSLIKQILKNYKDLKIVVIGGENEKIYVASILDNIKNSNIINVAGATTLDELISIIKYAKFVITNDSGPMHIAFSCKTPTISLFGPCSPSQYGKHNLNISIYSNAYCSPCIHDFINPPCKGNNICMKLITTDYVFKKVVLFIENSELKNDVNKNIVYQFDKFTIGTLNRSNKQIV